MKKLHKSLFVMGQISLEDIDNLAEAGVKTIINNRPDNEEPGQLSQLEASEHATQKGIDYVYLPMISGQAMPATLISDFKAVIDNDNGPILAHCRSGMRSSFIWALGQVAEGSMTVDEVIQAAQNANISLANYRAVLESAVAG